MPEYKILLIDDDKDQVEAARLVLEARGYRVFFAYNRQEGMTQVEKTSPDLIIMDVMMEKMSDGFDLSRKLKSHDQYKKIPILMLTSVGEMTGFRYSADAGDRDWLPVDDFCEKPLSPDMLISKVEQLLNLGKPQS